MECVRCGRESGALNGTTFYGCLSANCVSKNYLICETCLLEFGGIKNFRGTIKKCPVCEVGVLKSYGTGGL